MGFRTEGQYLLFRHYYCFSDDENRQYYLKMKTNKETYGDILI